MSDRRSPFQDRRGRFLEKLSYMLIAFSSVGALLVLIDPVIVFTFAEGTVIKIGGQGFSDQLKGGVVMLMIVGGFTGLIGFWYGSSATSTRQSESMSRIAEASAPVAAAAVAAAAAPGSQIRADDVKIEAAGDVTVEKT